MDSQRPISPHIQIYKPQVTSVFSIIHRISGVGLIAGTVLLSFGIVSFSFCPTFFEFYVFFLNSFLGSIVTLGLIFSAYFHLFNGIRHLIWDKGCLMKIKHVNLSAWLVLLLSLLLTFKTAIGILS
ncbi:MAG TPA: succinate dehydrogenase, cytochrome b556 subunit [Alphaproteobacteria bacterium]|nr:succinate dehydrogenase, cytochrome b556 subunit [Alphaproteobacteria bacterium]